MRPADATAVPAPLAPLAGRVRAYLAERFPLPVITSLAVASVAAPWAAAQQRAMDGGAPLVIDGTALASVVMTVLFLFLLRVFDEHKDFAVDAATRPDRPVQRGLITLAELRLLGGAAVAVQLALAFAAGGRPGLVYLVPLGWSVLMFFEFFAREWLAARLFLYALTHTVVMSLLALAIAARAGDALPPAVWGAALLALTSSLAIDVLRKSWAPENEVDGLDSYTRRLGRGRAGLLGAAVLTASAAAAGWAGWQVGGRFGWLAVLAAVTGWGLAEIAGFVRTPTPGRQKRLEMVAGVHLLVACAGVAVVAAIAHGAVLSIGDLSIGGGR